MTLLVRLEQLVMWNGCFPVAIAKSQRPLHILDKPALFYPCFLTLPKYESLFHVCSSGLWLGGILPRHGFFWPGTEGKEQGDEQKKKNADAHGHENFVGFGARDFVG